MRGKQINKQTSNKCINLGLYLKIWRLNSHSSIQCLTACVIIICQEDKNRETRKYKNTLTWHLKRKEIRFEHANKILTGKLLR